MADYFTELGCEPTGPEGADFRPHSRHFQVLAAMHGIDVDVEVPPASREAVAKLPVHKLTAEEVSNKIVCSVCLERGKVGEEYKILQCNHKFHEECILLWLKKHNTCPMCRDEMETDDKEYEKLRHFRRDEPNRTQRRDNLLNSMFT